MIVYWAGVDYDNDRNWDMLYKEPEGLISLLSKNKEKNDGTFFQCPAMNNHFKNTFVIKNLQHSRYIIDGDGHVIPQTRGYLVSKTRPFSSITNNILFQYGLSYAFFSEEENIKMKITGPYFSQIEYYKYGALVPAEFDISTWFRSGNFEFNLWEGVNEFELYENEPIAYVTFDTADKVTLKRFHATEELKKILKSAGTSSSWYPNTPLVKRYEMFKQSKLKSRVLKLIKENIME
jgi:hypothetical protein